MISSLKKAAKTVAKATRNSKALKTAVSAAQKATTAFANAGRSAVKGCQKRLRNRKIRVSYNARKRALKKEIAEMRAAGKSKESIARRAHKVRHDGRMSERAQMRKNGDLRDVEELEKRDLEKYGNKDGPNFDESCKRSRAKLTEKLGREPTTDEVHDHVAESATRTDVWTNIKSMSF